LGIGDWAQSPIPNAQSPIPNPQLILFKRNFFNLIIIFAAYKKMEKMIYIKILMKY